MDADTILSSEERGVIEIMPIIMIPRETPSNVFTYVFNPSSITMERPVQIRIDVNHT
jgi:hypothetical protein